MQNCNKQIHIYYHKEYEFKQEYLSWYQLGLIFPAIQAAKFGWHAKDLELIFMLNPINLSSAMLRNVSTSFISICLYLANITMGFQQNYRWAPPLRVFFEKISKSKSGEVRHRPHRGVMIFFITTLKSGGYNFYGWV